MDYYPSKYNFSYKINPKYTFINNNLTGAVDIIESLVWGFFVENKFLKIPNETISLLLERGYLYKDVYTEIFILKKLYKSTKKIINNKPKRIIFCPTYYCNLNCVYCFEKGINSTHSYFNDEKLNYFFEFIKHNKLNIDSLELYGGEPLLSINQKIVEKVLTFAKNKKLNITIITNGTSLDDYLSLLRALRENIEMVQITLDGVRAINDKRRKFKTGEGSFNIIIDNISKLLEIGINTNLRVNIDKKNVYNIPEFFEFIKSLGWINKKNFDVKLALVRDHSKDESYFFPEKLLEIIIQQYNKNPELEKHFGFSAFKQLRNIIGVLNGIENTTPRFINCETNILELLIFCPDGFIYTCPESIGITKYAIGQFYPNFSYSNSVKNTWRTKNILSIKKCFNCKFAPICGGGCTYSSFLISNGENPVCEKYNAVINKFLKYKGDSILKSYKLL